MNAVYFRHSPMLGQWQESGRDQEHAQLGVGLLASVCEVAWKQGIDLYEYDDNRLLAGAEYVALTNLWKPVPYKFYNNCQDARQSWVSINGRGRLDDRPIWEMIYNHYVVRKGLSAPYSQAMAQLMRPEHGSADHFGYGTLTFTLNGSFTNSTDAYRCGCDRRSHACNIEMESVWRKHSLWIPGPTFHSERWALHNDSFLGRQYYATIHGSKCGQRNNLLLCYRGEQSVRYKRELRRSQCDAHCCVCSFTYRVDKTRYWDS
jgi:hypothetical protein